jgi:hypothetical protein
MLWLRWRLTRNQWRRHGQLNAAITLILLVCALVLAAIGGIVGIVVGRLALSGASPGVSMLVWDGLVVLFLAFWTVGIVTELQRSEMLDISHLLFLPVSLRDVFLLNYVSSHFSLSLASILPVMLGLTVGLVLGSGVAMILLVPLIFAFFFMITAWTYCLRGWLASLMVNKRRRRAIIMGVTMSLVLLSQLPNLVMNLAIRDRMPRPGHTPAAVQQTQHDPAKRFNPEQTIDSVNLYVPLLWLPYGAKALAQHHIWPAVWGAFGMFAIGAWGLAQGYRSTLRFYVGGKVRKLAPPPPVARTIRRGKRILVERVIPAVPEEAGALALASLRSMTRAPEVKMSLATNVMVFVLLGAGMFLRKDLHVPAAAQPFVVTGAVTVALLGLAQLMFNHFGFDRGGFRAIVLLPSPRRYILMGKNIALLPVAAVVFAIYLGLATLLAHLGIWDILAGGVEFIAAFLAMSVLGNLAAVLAPYRIAAGSLKPTKTDMTTTLLLFVTHLLFPLAMAPIFLPAGLGLLCGQLNWLPAGAVTLFGALVLVALSALFYWQTLEPLGRLLQQREQKILQVVTREVE